MTVTSMTASPARDGASGAARWAWEIKTVNGKGLDVRLRLPPGFDAIEAPHRGRPPQRRSRAGRVKSA